MHGPAMRLIINMGFLVATTRLYLSKLPAQVDKYSPSEQLLPISFAEIS